MLLDYIPTYIMLLVVVELQSFLAGLAASGALTSALRLITKAAFENTKDGLRKGASMCPIFHYSHECFLVSIENSIGFRVI